MIYVKPVWTAQGPNSTAQVNFFSSHHLAISPRVIMPRVYFRRVSQTSNS
jgi:hypothetical protein